MQISLVEDRSTLVCIRTHAFPQSQDAAQMRRLIGLGKLQDVAGEIWGNWDGKICLGATFVPFAAIPHFEGASRE